MIYNILDDNGDIINTIIADAAFMEANYPGRYALVGPAPAPPPLPPIITKIAMLTRFTDAEYVGILAAAKTDVEVEGWLGRFNAANTINLEDSRTIAGTDLLVAKGLLTQNRQFDILTSPVENSERP